jgi:hypothetical protein
MIRTSLRALAAALLVAAQLSSAGQVSAQAVSLTTTSIWLPGPDGSGTSTYSGSVDQPQSAASNQLTGWVVDTTAQGWSGIDQVQVWNGPMGAGGQMLANAVVQVNRPDVGASLGNAYYAASGYSASIPASTWGSGDILYVYAHTPSKGWWYEQVFASGSAAGFAAGPRLDIEMPTSLATVHDNSAYTIRGTAYDPLADPSKGTGVDRVAVYLNGDRKTGIYIGDATLGLYDKFSQQQGQDNAGFALSFQPNSWMQVGSDNQITQLTVYAHSSVTGSETSAQTSIIITTP